MSQQPRRPRGTPQGGQFTSKRRPEANVSLEGAGQFPPGLEGVLGPATRAAWTQIRPYLPPGSYLAGGTAAAVHLRHRESRDLDFFTSEPLDVDELHETLERTTLPYTTDRLSAAARNMRVTLGQTKVEFSDASSNPLTEPTVLVAGVEVAGLGDLLAMKLATITKRCELRDFEDLRAIETRGGRRIEEGLALARLRYRLPAEADIIPMAAALSRAEDCAEDPLVPTGKSEVVSYFRRRLPEVIASLSRWDVSVLPAGLAEKVARLLA